MSLISLSCKLFKSPCLWEKFDLHSILGKGDQFFKFRYLEIEDLPQEFLLENCSINTESLKSRTGKIIAGAYLLSIAEIKNSVVQLALLILKNYNLGLIWGNYSSIYLFDSHSKDENGNLSSSGTTVPVKFDTLHSVEKFTAVPVPKMSLNEH